VPTEPLEVAIIEDDRRVREGLAALIDGTDGFRCQQAHRTVEEALRDRPQRAPEVILLDIQLPGMDGTDGLPLLLGKHPGASVLMLTVFDDADRVFTAICRGASGYLLKKTPPARLLEAIREVRESGAPMSPEIAHKVLRLFREVRPARAEAHDLTPTQVNLLGHLADGHSYQSAADALGVTINTVRNHVRAIYQALHVHTKSAAVAKALKKRII
jgi:DNA-binding NarL/FixJ family response regulator